jgi:hypothetical protein
MPDDAFAVGSEKLPLNFPGFRVGGAASQRALGIVGSRAVAEIMTNEDYILVVVDNFHGRGPYRAEGQVGKKEG